MKLIHTLTLAALALPLAAFGEDKEEKITFDQLPPKVAALIKKAAAGAEIKGVSKEDEDGKTAYEAGWDVGGKMHEITVAEDGTMLSDEQVIDLSEAPAAVRTAIEKAAGGKKVSKIEKVTEKGATIFEAVIGKKEIVFDDAGKQLKSEHADDDNDDDDDDKEGKGENREKGQKGEHKD